MENDKSYLAKKWKEAEDYYAATGLSISLPYFVCLMFLISVMAGALAYALTLAMPVNSANRVILPLASFLSMMSLVIGIPFHLRNSRIEQVEKNLPDVLRHIAAVLKAGGSIESALEEVSQSDYGPLSADIEKGLKQLREGRSIDEVLVDAAKSSGSTLFIRTSRVVVDSRKAGAGLAEVLDAISEDTRELIHIKRERTSRSTMAVSFLYITSLLLVPFIFGFVLAVVRFIGAGMTQAVAGTVADFSNFDMLLIAFMIVQDIMTNVAAGIISEGKFSNKLIYMPFMILISLFIYQVGGFIGQGIITGGGA